MPVPAEYEPLYKYLEQRYADIVVLTFAQIADLLGFALPASASDPGWWATADDNTNPSAQARSWIRANRTATPNVRAQTVAFERSAA